MDQLLTFLENYLDAEYEVSRLYCDQSSEYKTKLVPAARMWIDPSIGLGYKGWAPEPNERSNLVRRSLWKASLYRTERFGDVLRGYVSSDDASWSKQLGYREAFDVSESTGTCKLMGRQSCCPTCDGTGTIREDLPYSGPCHECGATGWRHQAGPIPVTLGVPVEIRRFAAPDDPRHLATHLLES